MEELRKIKKNTISRLPCRLLNPELTERSKIEIQMAPTFGRMVEMKCAKLRLVIFCAYLLTPWSRVHLEKLTGSAASQEIPRIFGTRRFITVLTSARHLSLSCKLLC